MKTAAAIDELDEPLVLRTTRVSDVGYVIIGALLTPICVYVSGSAAWRAGPQEILSQRGGLFHALLLLGYPGRAAIAAISIAMGWWLLCLAIGALWRLSDGRPALVADAEGIRFHPSLHVGAVAWSDVCEVRQVPGRSPAIAVVLDRRFWSTWACWTSCKVELYTGALRPYQSRRKDRLLQLWRSHCRRR